LRTFFLEAGRPGNDAIRLRVDSGAGNRRRGPEALGKGRVNRAVAAVAGGEGAGKRDDLTDKGGRLAGDLARIDAAQRPADNAHAALIAIRKLPEALAHAAADFLARAPVRAELPGMNL